MELRQIQYFQAVVKYNSFTEAAEQCHVSQSAISQQLRLLEEELGIQLTVRKGRSFELTPAGKHFYEKSLLLVADLNRLCLETVKIAQDNRVTLRIGYLIDYAGTELLDTINQFLSQYTNVDILLYKGTHEELYQKLLNDEVDFVLSDQRRKFSSDYVNVELCVRPICIEASELSDFADKVVVEINEIQEYPLILLASKDQESAEYDYYREILGFKNEFIFATNLEDARLLVVTKKGILPIEHNNQQVIPKGIKQIPVLKKGKPVTKKYCAFWRIDNSGYYIEEFGEQLKKQF